MDDVELLVLTFYEFAERQLNDALNGGSSHQDGVEQHSDDHGSNAGTKKAGGNAKPTSMAIGNSPPHLPLEEGVQPVQLSDEDELVIDNDDIVGILKDFHKKREERANNAELLGNPRMKKRSNFETEE